MKEGWICPRCGKVNSPYINQCTCEGDKSTLPISDVECDHNWVCDGKGFDTSGIIYLYHCAKCNKRTTARAFLDTHQIYY